MKTKRFILICLLLLGVACVPQRNDESLDALLWSTASAEYEAIAQQIFFQAKRQLKSQLDDIEQTAALEQSGDFSNKLPAVIVDLDETVLSNGAFHAQLLAEDMTFSEEAWKEWVYQSAARPVPGALEYTQYAAERGVTIFYITNRHSSLEQPTWENLDAMGFPLSWGKMQLLMRGAEADWDWDKSSRRAFIADHYRVVQIVGDSIGDFISGTKDLTPAERRIESSRYLAYWGERWFMLPNPVYGDWESSIVASGSMQTPLAPKKAKYRFIRGGESQGVW